MKPRVSKPHALIPWFPGTNCHREMAWAFELAGAKSQVVTIFDLVKSPGRLTETDLLGFAGGFSFGDHFRSGAVAAQDLVNRFLDQLRLVREKHIPILGVCNGFQILIETGLLPGDGNIGQPTAVLDRNLSCRFEHWTNKNLCFRELPGSPCLWTSSLEGQSITLPVAHGEGRPVPENSPAYIIAATYGTPEGDAEYSPNGSPVAGICSPDREILGLMPHPERRVDELRGGAQGLPIFLAGVDAVR